MNLLSYLKELRARLQRLKQRYDKIPKQDSITKVDEEDNIEIVIENNHNLFENESEIIKNGARQFLENGHVDSFEEGIKIFATIIRGLRYKRTEKDEDGHIRIIFEDIKLEHTPKKTKTL